MRTCRASHLYRSTVRGNPLIGTPDRQRATLTKIVAAVTPAWWLDALLVVGSLAADAADALSDIDLLVIVRDGQFEQAWDDRGSLRVGDVLYAWDQRSPEAAEVGAHRWLTNDLVLVEALIATPSSGVRLAEPWRLLAGDRDASSRLIRRPPIDRREMGGTKPHPVEAAYDEFKSRIRRYGSGRSAPL